MTTAQIARVVLNTKSLANTSIAIAAYLVVNADGRTREGAAADLQTWWNKQRAA